MINLSPTSHHWKSTSHHWLPIEVSPECKCRRVGPPPTNLGVRGFGDLTISMAECEGLALVTLAKMEK
jgi:hypothetical protein